MNSRLSARLALWLLLSTAAPALASTPSSLPALEVVQLVRSARIAEESGEEERALALLKDAVARYPSEILPMVELVAAAMRLGALGEVAQERELLTRRLLDPQALLPPSVALFLARAPEVSEDNCDRLLEAIDLRLPGADARTRKAYLEAASICEEALGRSEAARTRLAQLIELAPSDRFLWRAFHLDVLLERWDDALVFARGRVQDGASPAWVEALYLRALAARGPSPELDQLLSQIEANYPEGEALPPNIESLVLELAWVFYDQDETQRSESLFRFLEARGRAHAASRALVHLFGDEPEEKEAAPDQGSDEEHDPHALFNKGTRLLTSGEAAAAIGPLSEAAEGLPGFEPAWYNYGLAAMHLERWPEVAEIFGRVLELNPARTEAHLNRGLAFYHLQRCQESIDELTTFLTAQPDRFRAYYYLANCYRTLGKSGEADAALEKYRANQP